MKVLLTIWISAVLIQEVIPSTLVRLPRHASNQPSLVQTEYEAKYEQKGKNGNESSGLVTGKQEIVHDKCSEDWNAFADKCAALIKDLVASLANAVSSRPGDATNLQLQIKNTFRHFDNTHNCTCFNQSDIDLSPLFNNITVNTIAPSAKVGGNGDGADNAYQNNCGGNGQSCGSNGSNNDGGDGNEPGDGDEGSGPNDGNGNNSGLPQKSRQPGVFSNGKDPGVSPEGDGGSDATNNNRRQAKYPQILRQPENSKSSYPEIPNINRASPPFLVKHQTNSAPNAPATVPYSNDNNSPNGGPAGNGLGSDGQTPPGLLTLPTDNGHNSGPAPDGYSKPVVGVPAVVVPAGGQSKPKPAVIVPPISAPDNHYLDNGNAVPSAPGTNEGPDSNTAPLVSVDTTPEDDHSTPGQQIVGVPVTNSNSNLPESAVPESHVGNTNPLSNNSGPNPSVNKPNSATPEVLPVSDHDPEPESQITSVNGNPALPVADNHQLGVPSNAGNALTRPSHLGTLPVAAVPVSNAENSDPTGGNGSGNGNNAPSHQGASVPVYPVYVPNTKSPSGSQSPSGQPHDGSVGPQSNAGSGPGNGTYAPSVLNAAPVNNPASQAGYGSGPNGGFGNYPNAGTGGNGTKPVVVYPVASIPTGPEVSGQNSQGSGSPLTNDQNAHDQSPASDTVPVLDPTSGDDDGSDTNAGTPTVYPVAPVSTVPEGAGQNGQGSGSPLTNGQNANDPSSGLNNVPLTNPTSQIGNGIGPNTGSGDNSAHPASKDGDDSGTNTGTPIVYPVVPVAVVPEGSGQNGQGNGSPLTNAGSVPSGGQSGNDPSNVLNTVPVANPISQGGNDSGPDAGYGSGPNSGSGNDPNSGSGNGPNSGSGNGPNSGSGSSPDAGYGSDPNSGSGNGPNSGYGSSPDAGSGNSPNSGFGNGPNSGSGSSPDAGYGSDPNSGSGNGPDAGSGNSPNSGFGNGPNSGSGIGPNLGFGSGPNSGSSSSPGAGFGNSPNSGSGNGPNSGFGNSPNTRSGSSPGAGSGNSPNSGSGNGPNSGFANGPHSGSGSSPDAGYGSDPNSGSDNGPNSVSGNGPNSGFGNGPNTGSGSSPGAGSGNSPNSGSGNTPDAGYGSGPNSGSGSGGTNPAVAIPVEPFPVAPQNAGQTGHENGQNANDPSINSPTTQDGGSSGTNAGTPVVVPVPAVAGGPEQNGQGNGSPQGIHAIPASYRGQHANDPLNTVPIINPISQTGDGNGQNTGSGDNSAHPAVVYPEGPLPVEPQPDGVPTGSDKAPASNSGPSGSGDTGNEGQPGVSGDEDAHLEHPTTFQTTSSNPTSPQSILVPTESVPLHPNGTFPAGSSTSPQPKESHEDDEDDEDCCSCESCTEEEITDPKQYKENACKNLEEARRELKAIFEKIKKKLKCGGRKSLHTITTTESVNSN